MKIARVLFRLVLPAAALALGNGCATSALWNQTAFDCWNEPADETHLRLFQARDQKNFLVVYDEYSERKDTVHTRGYFLNENQRRIQDRRAPHFSSATPVHGLRAVPVLSKAMVSGAGSNSLFAVEGHQCFTLYLGASTNTYDLPVYNDGKGVLYRAALTPPAVIADVTIIGGFLWLETGCPPFASSQ